MGPDKASVAATAISQDTTFCVRPQAAMLPTVRHSM